MKKKHTSVKKLVVIFCLFASASSMAQRIILPGNGAYIYDKNGNYYDIESWDIKNNNNVVGIALITAKTKCLIALKNANSQGRVVWGPDGLVDGVTKTQSNLSNNEPGFAQNDYDGATNTSLEIRNLLPQKNTALYLANAYKFPNGQHGYLPALGELIEMFNNKITINLLLEKVGGEKIEDFWYWSSSQYHQNYRVWAYGGVDSNGNKWFPQLRNEESPLADVYGACLINVRAFGSIPQNVSDISSKTDDNSLSNNTSEKRPTQINEKESTIRSNEGVSPVSKATQNHIEHFNFMGIPLNGTITQFHSQLQKKGFSIYTQPHKRYLPLGISRIRNALSYIKSKTNVEPKYYKGFFFGYECDLAVFCREKDKVVYAVKIVLSHIPGKVTVKKILEDFKEYAKNNFSVFYDLNTLEGGAYALPTWTLYVANNDNTDSIGKVFARVINYDFEYYYYNLEISFIDRPNAPYDEW